MVAKASSGTYVFPDGGWGWVVLAAVTFHQILLPMVYATFGIFLLEFLDVYDVKPSTLTWIGALQASLMGFSGLIWGPLILKFGTRIPAMVAMVIISVGFLIAGFTTSLTGLFLTYGMLGGIGCGGLTLGGLVLIQHYFNKRRSFATGVVMAGRSLGQFLWPPVSELMIYGLSWRVAMVIMAGIALQGTIAGALMRPAPRTKNEDVDDTLPLQPAGPEEGGENGVTAKNRVKNQDNATEDDKNDVRAETTGDKVPCIEEKSHPNQADTESGNVVNSDEVIFSEQEAQVDKKRAGSLHFLKDPLFLTFLIGMFFVLVGHAGPIAFLPLKCVHEGMPKSTAALVAAMVGVGSCAGRLMAGWLGDRWRNHRFLLLAVTSLTAGVVSGLIAICKEPILMGILAIIFGLASGGYITFQMPVVVDIIGLDNLSIGAALSMAVMGLSHLILFSLSGHLLDLTGNPSYAFLILGCLQFLGGLVFFLLPVFKKRELRQQAKQQE